MKMKNSFKNIIAILLTVAVFLSCFGFSTTFITKAEESKQGVTHESRRTMLKYKKSDGYSACLYYLPTGTLEAGVEYTVEIVSKIAQGSSSITFDLYGVDKNLYEGNQTFNAITNRPSSTGKYTNRLRSSGSYGQAAFSGSNKSNNRRRIYTFMLTEEESVNKKFYIGYSFLGSGNAVEFYIGEFKLYKSDDTEKMSLLGVDNYSADIDGWCTPYGQKTTLGEYAEYNPSYFNYMAHFKYTGSAINNIGCVVNSGAIKKNVKYTISYDYYFVTRGFDNGVYPFLFGTKSDKNALSSSVAYYDRIYSKNYNSASTKTQFGDKIGGEYNSKSGYASYTFTIEDTDTLRDKYYVGFQLKSATSDVADFYISNLKLTAEGSNENLLPVDEYQYSFSGSNSGEKWRENNGWLKNSGTGFADSNYVAYGTGDGNIDGEMDIRDLVTASETVTAAGFNPFLDTNVDRSIDENEIKNLRYQILGLGIIAPEITEQPEVPEEPDEPVDPEEFEKPEPKPSGQYLIKNSDGESYGGSLNEDLYGKGAPLNGQYDVENSDYYTVNKDYYNMKSTNYDESATNLERVIFPKFASYQQTMQDSSGLASLMMVLNYAGKDVKNEYSEQALMERYESLTGKKLYGNGISDQELVSLINSLNLGYTAKYQDFGSYDKTSSSSMKQFFMENIKAGKFVLVRYQSPMGFGWKVVIGYDALGKVQNVRTGNILDAVSDDVIIFAEPNDGFDHQQDGYATERFYDFHVWWLKMATDTGTMSNKYSCVVIDPNIDIALEYEPVDETVKQTLYDIHLPLNPEGTCLKYDGNTCSYGGTRDYELYGSIGAGDGSYNHTNSNYYKINDFYNMGSHGSRILLPNYAILQQTMGSSCGICATNSVLSYYGHKDSQYDLELKLLDQYEKTVSAPGSVKGNGTNVRVLYYAIQAWGYKATFNYDGKPYVDYASYMAFMRSNLEAGKPIVVNTYLGSDHAMTVIGLDDMGTDYIYDDVVIIADSSDYWDGYQDGYVVHSAYKFFTQHTNKSRTRLRNYLVIEKP